MASVCTPEKSTLYTNCGDLNLNCYLYFATGGGYIPVPPGWYSKNDKCAYVSGNPAGYITEYCDCPRYYPINSTVWECDPGRNITVDAVTGMALIIPPSNQNNYLNCWGNFTPSSSANDWYYGKIYFDTTVNVPSPQPNSEGAYVSFKISNNATWDYVNTVYDTYIMCYDTRSFSTKEDACNNGI